MPRKKSNISVVTSIRLSEGINQFIIDDVDNYAIHRDRSDWIMYAIMRYMEYRIEQIKEQEKLKKPD